MDPEAWRSGESADLDHFNAMRDEALRNKALRVDPDTGLMMQKFGWGQLLRRIFPQPIYVTLSGPGPAYNFVEAIDQAGTWVTGKASGIAYEVNKITGLSGSRQWVHPDRSGGWRFQSIRYGSNSNNNGGTGNLPTCFCDPIPGTLTMTSFAPTCNYGMFQSCSIVYGPTPPGYADLDIGFNCYLSVESFPDVVAGGALFQYLLTCYYNQFSLSRVYLTTPWGSPYRDGLLYTWLVGSTVGIAPNYCTPLATVSHLYLLDGTPYPGSGSTCRVTITG
jgi:hypothetical protein